MKKLMFVAGLVASLGAFGEIQIINGMKVECVDGVCRIIEEDVDEGNETSVGPAAAEIGLPNVAVEVPGVETPSVETEMPSVEALFEGIEAAEEPSALSYKVVREAEGYCGAKDFLGFLKGERESSLLDFGNLWSALLSIVLILVGGFMMNLTPCVLPMIPINLMIIGKSAVRGAWYGLGIAVAYGTLGVLAAVGGLAFGTIQGNPWFNVGISALFVVLALAMSGLFFIDLSKKRAGLAQKKQSMLPWLFAFFMGLVSAVLAGACVAPILISVLLLTSNLYAAGNRLVLALPFVLGLGMALPWPFLGAGMRVLPKPGAWMKWVNRAFALLVLVFAAWYGRLAYLGFTAKPVAAGGATPATFEETLRATFEDSDKPVLVDCWATWCKNCAAMDKVLEEGEVARELENFNVIKLQAEKIGELKALKGFENVSGLPHFVIITRD